MNRKSPFQRSIRIEYYVGTALFAISIALWGYGRFRPQSEIKPVANPAPLSTSAPNAPLESEPLRLSQKEKQVQAALRPPEDNRYDPEEDAILRGQKMTNFTELQDQLVASLDGHYSESFSRDLSFALIKSLHEGRGNEEGVRETISKFLGKDSTPEKVDEIHKGFQKAVSSIEAPNP